MKTGSVARPLRRIFLTGLVCAALAAAAGIAIERARLGPDDPVEAIARVEHSARADLAMRASADQAGQAFHPPADFRASRLRASPEAAAAAAEY